MDLGVLSRQKVFKPRSFDGQKCRQNREDIQRLNLGNPIFKGPKDEDAITKGTEM